jgi:hypothetical protein
MFYYVTNNELNLVVPTGDEKIGKTFLAEEVKCQETIGQYALYMVHTLVVQIHSHPSRKTAKGWKGWARVYISPNLKYTVLIDETNTPGT